MPFDPPAAATTGGLADRSLLSLRAFFDAHGHHPNADHWRALADIARTIEAMANGTCPAKIWLSSCDPGCGKTQTVAHTIRALVADPAYRDVGVILCVGRITEAAALFNDLGLPPGRVAVLTNDDNANRLGHAAPNEAQVLLTTQQRIEVRCKDKPFSAVTDFHYLGQPRGVRIWDEAWLPGVAISINRDDLAGLLKPLRMRWPAMTANLEDLFLLLRTAQDDDLIPVPDWQDAFGVDLNAILGALADAGDDDRVALTGLFVLAGRAARVKRDGPTGSAMLTWKDTLPADLAPLLVLDASGRVRNTYADIEKHRGSLQRLASAPKDYSPLTVHVWQVAGSKSGWQRRGDDLTDGIVRTILTKPDQRWLVVHHKVHGRMPDVPRAARRQLPQDVTARVDFISWGQHMATNAFADVENVILAGTLFMRPSHYAALTHLAQGKRPDQHTLPIGDVERTTIGEHRNLLLQAICRGRVRKLDEDRCLPMDAYVIASPVSGIPGTLKDVFPGCRVERWQPLERALTGKLKAAAELVEQAVAVGINWIPLKLIREHIGVDNRQNFNRLVSKQPEWADAIASLGLEATTGKGGVAGLRMLPDADIRDDAE